MKWAIYIGAGAGGLIGGYVPVLFGADPLGAASLLWGTVGTIVGLYVGYKAAKYFEL